MNFRIDWIDGAPEKLEPGMVVRFDGLWEGQLNTLLIGHVNSFSGFGKSLDANLSTDKITRWGWLVQPHELEWIADMAQRHGKGRPEE